VAKALGARVYANARPEIGWHPVCWTEAGVRDLAVSGCDTVFHWHGETFDLPHGAELLAWSDGCRHQAYRAGHNVYGLQFHLEATPEMIADWVERDVDVAIDPGGNGERARELAGRVFGRWCDVARRGEGD
jgi:GMP synthase-like glutamine amidotransferase